MTEYSTSDLSRKSGDIIAAPRPRAESITTPTKPLQGGVVC